MFGNYLQSGCQQILKKDNSINMFSYQCAYQFILIFLLAISIPWHINELLELFTVMLIE